jgi:tetratricopeptide (TPR) repeat protein
VAGAAVVFAWRTGTYDGPSRHDPTQQVVAQQSTPADPLNFGRLLMQKDEFGLAAPYLRQAHQRQPDAATKAELAYCYFRLDEISSATVWLQRTLAQAPGNADVWSNLGYCHLRLGDYRSAIECLDKALVLDPNHVLALHNRAACNLLVSQDLADQDFGVSRIHRALAGATHPHFALYATAARLHALALAQGRLEPASAEHQIRQHLSEAIRLGYPARQLRAARQFQPLASEPWLEELAARAPNSTATPELWTAHYQAPRPSSTTAQLALK